ncbi:hydrolase [Fluviibacter phosphoraccumulans]|jgi:nicotinamidase-related amidase|uniref:Hydrolase n=1 Tax=Fluviibacter phosphoraccumulans TaxID=1751046 RepID=A0A679IEA5_9RHOO|nr:hydrolase [Fluviibacter phosphoraccumulans]BBU67821.1 hydrolase [Fluviibacter phosphoraccumulans]BBU70640.1 hydrolase [Fluviibacter phosphoraccumulans]BCA66005.1 hydrolase [Fluviibacter phosphoraccumulans]
MRLNAQQSVLLIIDVQGRLSPAIDGGTAVIDHTAWLIGVARQLGVPVMATEQYPQGLGATEPKIADLLLPGELLEKSHFSAVAEGNLFSHVNGNRRQWVVCGTESHVCVQQTVLDLLAAGRQVAVVEEAVGSRKASDKALALKRMRQHGADIVSREMVAFEWLNKANTPQFKAVLKEFIR